MGRERDEGARGSADARARDRTGPSGRNGNASGQTTPTVVRHPSAHAEHRDARASGTNDSPTLSTRLSSPHPSSPWHRESRNRRPHRARSGVGGTGWRKEKRPATVTRAKGDLPTSHHRSDEARAGRAGDGGGGTGKATRRNPATPTSSRREADALPARHTPGPAWPRRATAPADAAGAHGRAGPRRAPPSTRQRGATSGKREPPDPPERGRKIRERTGETTPTGYGGELTAAGPPARSGGERARRELTVASLRQRRRKEERRSTGDFNLAREGNRGGLSPRKTVRPRGEGKDTDRSPHRHTGTRTRVHLTARAPTLAPQQAPKRTSPQRTTGPDGPPDAPRPTDRHRRDNQTPLFLTLAGRSSPRTQPPRPHKTPPRPRGRRRRQGWPPRDVPGRCLGKGPRDRSGGDRAREVNRQESHCTLPEQSRHARGAEPT